MPDNRERKDSPFFSIIVCTYNRAGLLKRALDSILSQSCGDWEALIIDDASTDDTELVVTKYTSSDKRIKYFHFMENSGSGISRNRGIRLSSGKYITFLDSDDEYLPEHLELRKKYLVENPGIDLLYGDVEIIGNEFVPDLFNPGKKISARDCICGATFVIEKKSLAKLGGFEPVRFGEDRMLYDEAVRRDLSVRFFNERTYLYHKDNPDSLCNNLVT